MATGYNQIQVIELPAITVAAGQSVDTLRIPLGGIRPNGNFSIIATITSSGTAKIDYLVKSFLAGNFVLPETDSEIITGLTATSGSASDGVISKPFAPNVAPYLAFRISETGTANSVTVQINLHIQ